MQTPVEPDVAPDDLDVKVARIRRAVRDEYTADTNHPWIIGFSGGKDSTLVLHLVVEMLLDLPPDLRTRPVYVLSNDTRVESPVYQAQVEAVLSKVKTGLGRLDVPVKVARTGPDPATGGGCGSCTTTPRAGSARSW